MRSRPATESPDAELTDMNSHDDFQTDRARDLQVLARHIKWRLRERPFYIVFEDEIDRHWPLKMISDAEREKQIQDFAEFHGWKAFIHKTDSDRIRAIFLSKDTGSLSQNAK